MKNARMSINFIIHSWRAWSERRRALDHTDGWCSQMDYEDLKMKHSAFRKRSTGQHHERKWIKWPGIKCSTGPVCGLWVRRISGQIRGWPGSHPGQMREALMTRSSRVASHHKYCIKLYYSYFVFLGLGLEMLQSSSLENRHKVEFFTPDLWTGPTFYCDANTWNSVG